MDERTTLITEITSNLPKELSKEMVERISDLLICKLKDYEVSKITTELMPLDDDNINILKQFILTKKMHGASDGTVKRYYEINSFLLYDLNKNLDDITSFDLTNYLTRYKYRKPNKELSGSTLDGMRKCISSFFSWLYANNIISSNPMLAVDKIKYTKSVKESYTDIEIEKIKRCCTTKRDRALIEFLYSTGCRVSEVVTCNIEDVDFVNKSLIVYGKGNKERIVYLSDIALLYLKEYLEERTDNNPCLFASLRKPYNRIGKNGIETRLYELGNLSGVECVHPHKYRRTFATTLANRGVSIQNVATLLGHEDIRTTQIYCCIDQNNIRNAYQKAI